MWPFNLQKLGEKARGRETIGMFTCAEMTVIVICSRFKIKENENLLIFTYVDIAEHASKMFL